MTSPRSGVGGLRRGSAGRRRAPGGDAFAREVTGGSGRLTAAAASRVDNLRDEWADRMTPSTPAVLQAVADGNGGPIGVVVVSYGSPELLRRTLAGSGLAGDDVRVVVVDNFSSADHRHELTVLAGDHGWHLVALPDNRGFGAGCNAGVAAARDLGCTTFLFLNPDAAISPTVVAELRAHSLREPLALISPVLVDSAGDVVFRMARTDLRTGRVRTRPADAAGRTNDPGDWLCAACVVASDQLLRRIGGFAEDYFLYWEDVDLGYRTLRAGGTVVLREDLVAVHDEGGTHGADRRGAAKSALYYRYNCRNRLMFAAHNLPRRALLRWVLNTPSLSWDILMRGGRRQLLHRPQLLGAAVAGSLAGLGIALGALLTGAGRRPARAAVLVVHPGAELYGSDRVLRESVVALLEQADVTVAVPGPGPLVTELERLGARVVHVRTPVLRKSVLRPAGMVRFIGDAVGGLLPALRLVRRAGRDGVYVSTTILPTWPVLGRLARRRVVCHVHEAEWPGPAALHRVVLAPLRAAHTVVANSRFTRDVLTGLLPSLTERTVVVPNPVPGPAAPPAPRAVLTGQLCLLYVGRLSPRKGPDVAVAALAELAARGVDARLSLVGSVFAGYEWFEDELRATAATAGLADRVDFLGFRADVGPALRDADVVLVPSVLDESFGNTAVEAVLAARPVVVNDLGGLREAVAGYGAVVVVAPGRPELWADAVERLAADWERVRSTAVADAAEARHRQAPDAYHARLAGAVLETGPRRTAPVGAAR
jgi:GT2 family glycosyltransferase/glycosyltransferase involved in cell wall biosynthesis